jgi:hypothetical protein
MFRYSSLYWNEKPKQQPSEEVRTISDFAISYFHNNYSHNGYHKINEAIINTH